MCEILTYFIFHHHLNFVLVMSLSMLESVTNSNPQNTLCPINMTYKVLVHLTSDCSYLIPNTQTKL